MSAAPAAAPVDGKAGGGTKKIIIIALAVLALLTALGVGAFALMQKNMADEVVEGDEAGETAQAKAKPERNTPPIFVPLEPFIVNLADQDSERFAQIGINLQVDSAKIADDMKVYMPAIRNEVLLLLSRKTANDLMTAEGKTLLASEIRRGSARAMGYEITEPDPANVIKPGDDEATQARKKRITRIRVDEYNPIVNVHYANFIIQ